MFKKIVGTLGTRIIAAILSFVTWILNANYLGAEQVGTIGLIIFSVAIIQLFVNFVSGSALIYQTPRVGVYRLLVPAYIWTPGITVISCFLIQLLGNLFPALAIIPSGYFYEVLFLALIMSMTSVNYMFLLGLEKVKEYNVINMLQTISLFCVLIFEIFVMNSKDVMTYISAIFISYILAYLVSIVVLRPFVKRRSLSGTSGLLKEILHFGTYVQFANFFQTFNYRLSLKFVDHFLGRSAVGVLTIGLQLAEGLWLISRSIGTVQYSRMANEMKFDYSVGLTLTFAKIAWIVTALAMVILLCIPESFFVFLFSKSFAEVKAVIASLSVGIVMLSISIIFSGFYSAINKPYHNMISSAIGLVFTIIFGILLIPKFGILGAGISASISYFFIATYQFTVFNRLTKMKIRNFILSANDIRELTKELNFKSDS